MNDIEKAALRTYLWWKNRYYAIQNALPGDNVYEIVSGIPEKGFCDAGPRLGVPPDIVGACNALAPLELEIRNLLREGKKDEALEKIPVALARFLNVINHLLGAEFISENEEVFIWR